jgi:hypothetical protein
MINKAANIPYPIFKYKEKEKILFFKYLYLVKFLTTLPLSQPSPIAIIEYILNNKPKIPKNSNPNLLIINGKRMNPVIRFKPTAK